MENISEQKPQKLGMGEIIKKTLKENDITEDHPMYYRIYHMLIDAMSAYGNRIADAAIDLAIESHSLNTTRV